MLKNQFCELFGQNDLTKGENQFKKTLSKNKKFKKFNQNNIFVNENNEPFIFYHYTHQ